MARCAFGAFALDTVVSGELTNWISPSSTPPSACLSSTTSAPRAFETPSAARHSLCSSPATLSSGQQLQRLPQHQVHQQQRHRQQLVFQKQQDQQKCCRQLHDHSLPPRAFILRLPSHHQAQAKSLIVSLQPARLLAGSCAHPQLPAVAAPCQAALFRSGPDELQLQQHQAWQQQQQQQRERRRHDGVNGGMMLRQQSQHQQQQQQQQQPSLKRARARELDSRENLPLQSRRYGSDPSAAPPCGSFTSSRCLQRYNSLDSDVTHAASSFPLAAATATTTITTNAATAALATASSAILHVKLPLPTAAPPPPRFLPCHHLLASRPVWALGHTVGYAVPPPTIPCAADGDEFILHASRALQLCPDTSAQLALHVWRRTSGMVRLVLSIRQPTSAGGDDPRVAASTYRIYATACLWLAAKVEEQRRLVAEARVLAALAQTSPAVLCAAELRLLAWVEWCPLRGYLPAPPQRLGLGPGST